MQCVEDLKRRPIMLLRIGKPINTDRRQCGYFAVGVPLILPRLDVRRGEGQVLCADLNHTKKGIFGVAPSALRIQ